MERNQGSRPGLTPATNSAQPSKPQPKPLDARALFPSATLADLYDPLTMPPSLLKAHQTLDLAVDVAYGKKSFAREAERVAFLFERSQAQTSFLPEAKAKTGRKRVKA